MKKCKFYKNKKCHIKIFGVDWCDSLGNTNRCAYHIYDDVRKVKLFKNERVFFNIWRYLGFDLRRVNTKNKRDRIFWVTFLISLIFNVPEEFQFYQLRSGSELENWTVKYLIDQFPYVFPYEPNKLGKQYEGIKKLKKLNQVSLEKIKGLGLLLYVCLNFPSFKDKAMKEYFYFYATRHKASKNLKGLVLLSEDVLGEDNSITKRFKK